MVVKLLDKYLQDQGYVACKTKCEQITEYCKEESNCTNILQVIDYKEDSQIDCATVEEQKNMALETANGDVHIMTLVFYDNLTNALSLMQDEYMCWFIDKKELILADNFNRVEDFYGLKAELSGWLSETKALLQSGDVTAISDRLMSRQEKEVYEKRKKKKPSPVSVILVVVNSIIYLACYVIGDAFIASGQMDYELVGSGEIYRFLTAMFLHGGIQHLAGNMILLYFMGEMIEHKTGSGKYAVIYLLSGIMGNVVSYMYEMLSGARYVSVGASGGVYGIIGAVAYLVLRKTKGLNVDPKRLLVMLGLCVYSSFATPHVDFAAHIGGLIAGFVITALLCPRGGKAESES